MTGTGERSRTVTVLSAVVALSFLGAGAGKLIGADQMVKTFQQFGFGTGFMRFIGAAEIAGAVGLFLPRVGPMAAAGLALVVSGAVVEHVLHDAVAHAVPAAVLLVLCAFLAWSRRGELLG